MNEEKKQVKRFDIKTEAKLLTKISKLLVAELNPLSEEATINKEVVAPMDPATVCMIIARTEEAKRVLSRFCTRGIKERIPEMDFTTDKIITSKYSTDYLKRLIDIFQCMSETVKFSMSAEYPLMMENEHFKVMLAPRVEND